MKILIYSSTVICSMTLELINKIAMVKKLANLGYKFDNLKIFSTKYILYLIPIMNLIIPIKNIFNFKNLKNIPPKKLYIKKGIIPMTKLEKEIYLNKSSLLNALSLNFKNQAKADMILIYMKDEIENIIYFTKEHELNIIISTKGPVANLPRNEQYKQLQEQLNEINMISKMEKETERLNEKEISKFTNIRHKQKSNNNITLENKKIYTKKAY